MRREILNLLETNSRLTPAEIAAMLGRSEEEVASEIKNMEDEKIICGYHTLIDWDKLGKERVTALIGLKISPVRGEGFDRISTRISKFEEVKSVFLMSGSSNDLILTIEGDSLKDISHFVYEKIAPMDSVVSTATYFVLKKYKDHKVIMTEGHGDDMRVEGMA
ncbi:MAG TPA: AsnC family transcriptional regulator [Lachnospiraceae bacterium]|jgi:DNA-binding Lrp family transcriptional regulator|nr:AsnC family transcriptional regulator [Lachnospiraceae bacterium]